MARKNPTTANWTRGLMPPLLHTLHLQGVDWSSGASAVSDSLWEYGNDDKGTVHCVVAEGENLPKDAAKSRIREALANHCWSEVKHDHHGRMSEKQYVHPHLWLYVSEERWQAEKLNLNNDLKIVANNLAVRLRQDLGTRLKRGAKPRVAIQPLKGLADSAVAVQFGAAVFVPDEGEEPIANIELSLAQQDSPISGWQEYCTRSGIVRKPMAWYRDQTLVLITGELANAEQLATQPWLSASYSGWAEQEDGWLLLKWMQQGLEVNGGKNLLINPVTDQATDGLVASESGELNSSTSQASAENELRYTIANTADGQSEPQFLLHVQLLSKDGVGQQLKNNGDVEDGLGGTASRAAVSIVDGLQAVVSSPSLSLVGWALPKLPQKLKAGQQDIQLSHWQLAVDQDAEPERQSAFSNPEDAAFVMKCRSGQTAVTVRRGFDNATKTLNWNFWQREKKIFDLDFSRPPSEAYAALVANSGRDSWRVDIGKVRFGRGATEGEDAIDVHLDQLHQEGSLWQSSDKALGATLAAYNLSRQHFWAEMDSDGCLRVGLLPGASSGLLVLDSAKKVKQRLDTREQTALLMPDQYIVVGCYLLQFNRGR